MTSSPLRSKSNNHARSVSLPSRLHPIIPQLDEHLRLNGLENMYDRLDSLLLMPHAQQSNEKWVEVVLEKYLSLLDMCSTVKDVSSQTKQDFQGLLSIVRRRRDACNFSGSLNSRKKAKKVIQKSLKDLKSIKSKHAIIALGKSREIIDSLNEVEAATIGVFESLLSYISGTKAESSFSGFPLLSKFTHRRSVASKDEEANTNAFENFDAALHSLNHQKTSEFENSTVVENAQNQLGTMESSIQDIEQGLECLFRWLIKTRVILLNILNH